MLYYLPTYRMIGWILGRRWGGGERVFVGVFFHLIMTGALPVEIFCCFQHRINWKIPLKKLCQHKLSIVIMTFRPIQKSLCA